MSSRRIDSKLQFYNVVAPDFWTERKLHTSPGSDIGKGSTVAFLSVNSKDVSAQQLDPREITAEYLISTGKVIDPGQVQRIFNITDPADINNLADHVGTKTLQYLIDNEPNFDFESNRIISKNVE